MKKIILVTLITISSLNSNAQYFIPNDGYVYGYLAEPIKNNLSYIDSVREKWSIDSLYSVKEPGTRTFGVQRVRYYDVETNRTMLGPIVYITLTDEQYKKMVSAELVHIWEPSTDYLEELKEKANSDTLNKIELPIIEGAENKIYDFKTGELYKNFNSIPVGARYIYNNSINIKIAKDGYRFLKTID